MVLRVPVPYILSIDQVSVGLGYQIMYVGPAEGII